MHEIAPHSLAGTPNLARMFLQGACKAFESRESENRTQRRMHSLVPRMNTHATLEAVDTYRRTLAHRAPQRSLRVLLLVGLVLVNILMVVWAVDSLSRSRQQYEKDARNLTQNVTRALDLNLTKNVEKVDLALRVVVDELERQLASKGIDEQAALTFLALQEQRLPEVEAFRVSRADGLVILGKGLVKEAKASWADRDDFNHHRAHADSGLQVTKPRMGRVAQQYIVGFSRRYNHPDGSFAGTVSAPISVDQFTRLLSQFDVGPKGILILRDADLGLIARVPPLPNSPNGQVGSQVVSDDFRRAFESGEHTATGFTSAGADGLARIFTFHRMQAAPLVTIVATAQQDYMNGWMDEVYRALAMGIGFFLLSVLLGASQFAMLRRAEQYSASLLESHTFVRNVLDSLGEQVAVIDGKGVITTVNASWRRFAAANGVPAQANDYVGANYLDASLGAPNTPRNDRALAVFDGTRAVLAGTSAGFFHQYPCNAASGQRWINLSVVPLMGDHPGAVMIHQDVTEQHEAEVKLRASEERYRLLADNVTDVIWVLDQASGRFTYVSPSVQQLRGYSPEEVMAQPLDAALTPQSAAQVQRRMQKVLAEIASGNLANLSSVMEVDQPHRDGRIVHTEVMTRYLLDAQGRATTLVGVSRDITQRKQQEQQLRASEEHFRMLAENMADMVWRADRQMRFTYVNAADRRMRGFPREEVVGFSISDALTAQGNVILADLVQRRRAAEASGQKGLALSLEIPMRHRNGGEVWIELSTMPTYNASGEITGFQGIGRDISERKRRESELVQSHHALESRLEAAAAEKIALQEQAIRDALTGVFNRRYLDETLPRELSRAKREGYPVAVIMLDLDHFKRVNDQYSHAAGDEVLRALSALLSTNARDSDMVCRYGGEEFAVIMPGMTAELALERVESWRAALEALVVVYGEHRISVTLSAGIAMFPEQGDQRDALLACADEMLYRSKREGRNRITVYAGSFSDSA